MLTHGALGFVAKREIQFIDTIINVINNFKALINRTDVAGGPSLCKLHNVYKQLMKY